MLAQHRFSAILPRRHWVNFALTRPPLSVYNFQCFFDIFSYLNPAPLETWWRDLADAFLVSGMVVAAWRNIDFLPVSPVARCTCVHRSRPFVSSDFFNVSLMHSLSGPSASGNVLAGSGRRLLGEADAGRRMLVLHRFSTSFPRRQVHLF